MLRIAPCKINLGLDVLRRRADGYHDVETVMYPVRGLHDRVSLEPAVSDRFSQTGLAVDCPPSENLCLRALEALRLRRSVPPVSLKLEKRVPFGAGLGGGSSDAAAVLVGCNERFALGFSFDELEAVAATIGSDVPFFIRGVPRFCSGRGDVLSDIDVSLTGLWIALIKPSVGVNTRQAYAGITPAEPLIPLRECLSQPLAEWQQTVKNDFEEPIFALYPQIAQAKESLIRAGALYASMSGSGSAVFGLFVSKPIVPTPFVYQL